MCAHKIYVRICGKLLVRCDRGRHHCFLLSETGVLHNCVGASNDGTGTLHACRGV